MLNWKLTESKRETGEGIELLGCFESFDAPKWSEIEFSSCSRVSVVWNPGKTVRKFFSENQLLTLVRRRTDKRQRRKKCVRTVILSEKAHTPNISEMKMRIKRDSPCLVLRFMPLGKFKSKKHSYCSSFAAIRFFFRFHYYRLLLLPLLSSAAMPSKLNGCNWKRHWIVNLPE